MYAAWEALGKRRAVPVEGKVRSTANRAFGIKWSVVLVLSFVDYLLGGHTYVGILIVLIPILIPT
jgi:hypothetical protein